jgi:hypothetical protein
MVPADMRQRWGKDGGGPIFQLSRRRACSGGVGACDGHAKGIMIMIMIMMIIMIIIMMIIIMITLAFGMRRACGGH